MERTTGRPLLMDALRLMLGTLTVLPVPPPRRVDRATAGLAMLLAPVGGALLAALVGGALWLAVDQHLGLGPLVLATLAIGALAALTRGLHLDGLADVADGLGSGRHGEGALAVMKQSDIGPFGVVTLVLALLVQVAALAQLLVVGWGPATLALALVVSRGLLPLLCTSWFPAARPDGLGATVATSVRVPVAFLGMGAALGLGAALFSLFAIDEVLDHGNWVGLAAGVLAALLGGVLLALRARSRFGGVTGDIYGAAVELTFTAVLVLALLAAP